MATHGCIFCSKCGLACPLCLTCNCKETALSFYKNLDNELIVKTLLTKVRK